MAAGGDDLRWIAGVERELLRCGEMLQLLEGIWLVRICLDRSLLGCLLVQSRVSPGWQDDEKCCGH